MSLNYRKIIFTLSYNKNKNQINFKITLLRNLFCKYYSNFLDKLYVITSATKVNKTFMSLLFFVCKKLLQENK